MRDEKNNGMPFTEIRQIGLYSTDEKEVKELAERVASFNHRRRTEIVLDVIPRQKGDALHENGPYYNLNLTFPNREIQDAFWLE
jgi:hypothetical protein